MQLLSQNEIGIMFFLNLLTRSLEDILLLKSMILLGLILWSNTVKWTKANAMHAAGMIFRVPHCLIFNGLYQAGLLILALTTRFNLIFNLLALHFNELLA